MSSRRRVLFAALYPTSQAGTRLRGAAWFEELRRNGVEPELWTFFGPADSDRWFGNAGRVERLLLVLKNTLRAALLWLRVPRYDAVVVLREALPFATTVLEARVARRSRLVWDVDDAIWTAYPRMFFSCVPDRLRRSEGKYRRLAGLSREVWAGSEELAQWCRAATSAPVWVLPTVPVLPEDLPAAHQRHGVVWVGSRSTAPFLEQVLPELARLGEDIHLTVVGASVAAPPGLTTTCVPWSEAAEDEALRRARLGLYPLDLAHPLAAARAGFKAVLYMAYGVPCVATPVPAVQQLVRDGVDGLHVRPEESWDEAVGRLLRDDALWRRLSASSRERARTEYSTSTWAPRVARRLADLLSP